MSTITPNDTRINKINPHLVSFIPFLNGFNFWLQVLHSQCGFDLHINNILRNNLKTQYYRSTKLSQSVNKQTPNLLLCERKCGNFNNNRKQYNCKTVGIRHMHSRKSIFQNLLQFKHYDHQALQLSKDNAITSEILSLIID
jgi:hypothetical protein